MIWAANNAKVFGYSISKNFTHIQIYIGFIRKYDKEIKNILDDIHELLMLTKIPVL